MDNIGQQHGGTARFDIEKAGFAGFRYAYFDASGALVFRSGPFKSQAEAFAAIAALKRQVKSGRFQRLSKAEFLCFTITGPNTALLATSTSYPDAAALERAIAAVARDLPTSPVFNGAGAGTQ